MNEEKKSAAERMIQIVGVALLGVVSNVQE
jgi:hypothetical protein